MFHVDCGIPHLAGLSTTKCHLPRPLSGGLIESHWCDSFKETLLGEALWSTASHRQKKSQEASSHVPASSCQLCQATHLPTAVRLARCSSNIHSGIACLFEQDNDTNRSFQRRAVGFGCRRRESTSPEVLYQEQIKRIMPKKLFRNDQGSCRTLAETMKRFCALQLASCDNLAIASHIMCAGSQRCTP